MANVLIPFNGILHCHYCWVIAQIKAKCTQQNWPEISTQLANLGFRKRQAGVGGGYIPPVFITNSPVGNTSYTHYSTKYASNYTTMSVEPSNKCVIDFYLIQKPMQRDEGEQMSNKGEDLYGGGSPVSHVIQWELAGGPQVIFPPSQPAPVPRLRQWPLPSFSAWP